MRPTPSLGAAAAPWSDTVVYEAHVRGLTKLHPQVPAELRGTYLGLAQPAVLEHLVRLGITTVELMPVWAFLDELRLVRLGAPQLLGLQPVRLHGARAALCPRRSDGGIPRHGRRAARRGHRGRARRGAQPHRRDRPSRARPCRCAASTTPPTIASIRPTRAATWTGPAAATASTSAIRGSCSWPWMRCGTGPPWAWTASVSTSPRRSAGPRRRVPARCGAAAGDRPGPGAGPPEADRRAVGPRAGRLPPGAVPAALRDVERSVPRLRPPVLARRRGDPAGAGRPAAGLGRPLRGRGPQAASSASTWSPATTASRSPTSSAMPGATTRPTARAIAMATTTI